MRPRKRELTRPQRRLKATTANTVIGVGAPRAETPAAPMALPEEVPVLPDVRPIADSNAGELESGVGHRSSLDLEDWEPTEVWETEPVTEVGAPDFSEELTQVYDRSFEGSLEGAVDRPSYDDAAPTAVWDTGAHPSPPEPMDSESSMRNPLPSIIVQDRPAQASNVRLVSGTRTLPLKKLRWIAALICLTGVAYAATQFADGQQEEQLISQTEQIAPLKAKPAPPPPPTSTPELKAPSLSIPDGKPQDCERWSKGASGPDPVQGKAAWRMARKALQQGDTERAHEMFCLSAHFDPQGAGTADLIRYYFQTQDIKTAAHWAHWASEQNPEDAKLALLLADAELQLGRQTEARDLLLKTLKADTLDDPKLARVASRYANGGFRALNSRDRSQAERLFRRAALLAPNEPLAIAGMARVELARGEKEKAQVWAEKAVTRAPESYHAHLVMGDVQQALGNQAQAKASWKRAAELQP